MLSSIANAGSPGKLAALSAMSETNSIASAGAKLGRLQGSVQSGDYSTAETLLTELKLMLLDFPALPPTMAPSKHGNQELQIARESPTTPTLSFHSHRPMLYRGHIRSCMPDEHKAERYGFIH